MTASVFWSLAHVLAFAPVWGLAGALVYAVARSTRNYRRQVAAARRAEVRRRRFAIERPPRRDGWSA